MRDVKRFKVKREYQEVLLNSAVLLNGTKYVRGVVANYPQDWVYHPASYGYSNYEDWEYEFLLPISPDGKELYLPVHDEGLLPDNEKGVPVWYDLVKIIIDEFIPAYQILTPS